MKTNKLFLIIDGFYILLHVGIIILSIVVKLFYANKYWYQNVAFSVHLNNTLLAKNFTQWHTLYASNIYVDNNRGENNLDGSKNDLGRVVRKHLHTYTNVCVYTYIYNMTYTLHCEFSLINCHSRLPVLTVMYVHTEARKSSISFGVPVDLRHLLFATTPIFHVNNLVLSCKNLHHHNGNRCTLQRN